MRMTSLSVGPIDENCYLVFAGATRRLYVIDPGADAERIVEAAEKFPPYDEARILLTHAHVDHIGAVGEVTRRLRVTRVMLDPADVDIYRSPYNEIPPILPAARGLPETADFAPDGDFEVLRVPGHTPGGCAFLFEEGDVRALFCGDTLFAGSVGRTDLPGGDWDTLMDSIRRELLPLPPATRVFPGHGGSTTIEEEKHGNPYLR
jgi:glyoxylase-like metal-dependent hydrolase (beta-lactamase superfamily II)